MRTLEIVSFGYGLRLAQLMKMDKIHTGSDNNFAGTCFFIEKLLTIGEFNGLLKSHSGCEFIILPNFSPYSHFAANIWNSPIPVVTLGNSEIAFEGDELILIDFTSGVMIVAQSENDREILKFDYSNRQKSENEKITKGYQNNNIEILGEATSFDEIEICFSEGASGVGVLKAELFYDNELINFKKVNEIKSITHLLGDSFPLLLRFFDYEIIQGNARSWQQPTKYLGYRGVRILEIEKEWFNRFSNLLEVFETDKIIPIIPMVTTASEVFEFKNHINSKYNKVGVTVETPAAALCINEILQFCSFIEIGLNDLTQYTMAWDRDIPNEKRLPPNQIHPAVSILIRDIIKSCNEHQVDYALGLDLRPSNELAKNLAQIGIRKISCSPYLIKHWIKAFQTASF